LGGELLGAVDDPPHGRLGNSEVAAHLAVRPCAVAAGDQSFVTGQVPIHEWVATHKRNAGQPTNGTGTPIQLRIDYPPMRGFRPERMTALREALDISHAELARRAGVGQSTVNRLENGDIENPRQVYKI